MVLTKARLLKHDFPVHGFFTRDGAGVHKNLSVEMQICHQDSGYKKTYPEVVSRSMPRTLKDFCQRACSQKLRRAPPRKKIQTAQVRGLRTVRICFVRFYGFRTVRKKLLWARFCGVCTVRSFWHCNPGAPLAAKVLAPPLTTPACVQMGASVGLPAAIPLLIRF